MPTDRARISTRKWATVIAIASVLFAAVFALRLLAGDDPATPVLILALVPVTLLAVELGARAGLAGSFVVFAMLIAWVVIEDPSLSPLDWAWRIALFPALALFAARLATLARTRITAGWRSRDRLMQVIATAHEGFVSMDADGVITAWNPEAETIFGWSADEAIGRTVADTIIPEQLRDSHWDGLSEFLMTAEGPLLDKRVELEATDRDGRSFPVEIVISPIHEPQGWSFHAFMHEITDRKRTEHELRSHVADLGTVIDATRDLARSTDAGLARTAICEGAREVSGAEVAILFEPDSGGVGLRATSALGAGDVEGTLLPFIGEPAGALRTFSTGEPYFLSDVVGHNAVAQRVVEQTGAVSVLWQPVLREGVAIGVLTVVWRQRVDAISTRLARVMELLAAEATVAIERADLLARLDSMARTDDLTGLPNRRAWYEELPRELARARRYESPICVAMLDLDRFKDYNDRLGHLAGDRLLKVAAGAWRETLRETDRLARYGGEEFSVVLPDCEAMDALILVERLRSVTPGGETCSAGLAQWDGAETPESLVQRADGALYEAKRTGRNRAVTADRSRDAQSGEAQTPGGLGT